MKFGLLNFTKRPVRDDVTVRIFNWPGHCAGKLTAFVAERLIARTCKQSLARGRLGS